jgi:ribosomal protein S6--L-glutamate ligase
MKLLVLCRGTYLYSTQRLLGAARRRGHEAFTLDPFDGWVCLSRAEPALHSRGQRLPCPDVVVPRIGASYTFYGLSILRQLEMIGARPVNSSRAVARARDKLRSLQIFSRQGVPTPRTAFVRNPRYVGEALRHVGGPPVIIKVLDGAQGVGVMLAESESSAQSMVETMNVMNQNILLQEFVEETKGRDIRALVLGDRVVAAMVREALPGEFRSNLHRGGSARSIDLDEAYRETAVRAARVLGLNLAGVDLLESRDGPKVIEVNSSPGFEGLERATGADVAGAVVEWIESDAAGAQERPEGGASGATRS